MLVVQRPTFWHQLVGFGFGLVFGFCLFSLTWGYGSTPQVTNQPMNFASLDQVAFSGPR